MLYELLGLQPLDSNHCVTGLVGYVGKGIGLCEREHANTEVRFSKVAYFGDLNLGLAWSLHRDLKCSGVARQFCASGRTMKLSPLHGSFFKFSKYID